MLNRDRVPACKWLCAAAALPFWVLTRRLQPGNSSKSPGPLTPCRATKTVLLPFTSRSHVISPHLHNSCRLGAAALSGKVNFFTSICDLPQTSTTTPSEILFHLHLLFSSATKKKSRTVCQTQHPHPGHHSSSSHRLCEQHFPAAPKTHCCPHQDGAPDLTARQAAARGSRQRHQLVAHTGLQCTAPCLQGPRAQTLPVLG